MSNEKIKDILPLSTKVLYGVAEFGFSLMKSAVLFFLIFFYTDVLKYSPALVGTALLVGKLSWDALNDPLFGYISDRVNTRFGRRRPFMLLGAIPFGLSVWVMFSVPAGLTGAAAFFVVLGSFLFFDTFHTLVSVPYFAMMPELSRDYDERSSITAVKKIFGVAGYFAGAVLTTLVAGVFKNNFGLDEKAAYSAMGAVFGIVVTLTTLVTAFTVKERVRESAKPSEIPILKSFTIILKNRPFVRLMAAYLISSVGFTVMTGLFAYYMKYQLNMHTQLPLVLSIMMGTLALFLFFWKWVADRINKGPAYALGLVIACVAISTTFFLPYGPSKLIYIIAFVVGFGYSSQFIFPWSMVPDCIEYDELETNERREGIYYGVWAIIIKLAGALGVAVIGWSLSLSGYIAPSQGEVIVQSEQVRLAIRLFYGPIPALFMVLSLPLLIWFPITRKSHNALLDELDKRKL